MPSFNSHGGVWEPATERHVDPNAPIGKEIYQGPDRAAVQMLQEARVDHFGTRYDLDPELIMRARQLNFKDVHEYLSMYGFDPKKAEEAYLEHKATVVRHLDAPRKVGRHFSGGGVDTSREGQHRYGGFKTPSDAPGTNVHLSEEQLARPETIEVRSAPTQPAQPAQPGQPTSPAPQK